jgi:hypothetical protein
LRLRWRFDLTLALEEEGYRRLENWMETIGVFSVVVLLRGGWFSFICLTLRNGVSNRTVATFSLLYSMIITPTNMELTYGDVGNELRINVPELCSHLVSGILGAYVLRLRVGLKVRAPVRIVAGGTAHCSLIFYYFFTITVTTHICDDTFSVLEEALD